MSVEIGTKGYKEEMVTAEKTAEAVGSGSLPVYATPMMAALIELAACSSVQAQLEPGQTTVGTQLNISHLSATPVGMKVWAETELTAVDRRKLTFSVKTYDEKGLIGEGSHERFIIDCEKFMAKCQSKLG
ncbi:MAG: thioesterase family protein [Candidatus Limivicinus sp.]|jgi:fluoroacetyl-CoA thioesterase